MGYQLTGQKPAKLNPIHKHSVKSDPFDPRQQIEKIMVDPIFEPLNPSGSAVLLDDAGNQTSASDLLRTLLAATGENVTASAETKIKDVYSQGLSRYTKTSTLLVNHAFLAQAGASQKLPDPGPGVLYSAGSDVIPAAKDLIGGNADEELFFASLGYTYKPNTLGFWFINENTFGDFKDWLKQQTSQLAGIYPSETNAKLAEFDKLTLSGLTESLLLRKDDDSENHTHSFARVIIRMLMDYQGHTSATGSTGVLAFSVPELFLPKSLVLVNVEKHARSSASKVDKEWKLINHSIASPVKVISPRKLSKLTAMHRNAAKAAAAAANSATNKAATAGKMATVKFRKKAPTAADLTKDLLKVLRRMKQVNFSQNSFKAVKHTYTRPSRRHPTNPNRPGKVVSTQYLPDLHIYLDCSMSITESNYQDGIITLIKVAKKLNVNLYFTSYSHVMSQEVLLKTANKSINQIWQEFRRIPKVQGGTDYTQIWRYINASQARKRRLSINMTDFEWYAPSQWVEHPKNLYYAPMATSSWSTQKHMAKQFASSMLHIEPAIHQRLLSVLK